ncbi:MAG: hypothetical protein Q7T79_02645 [bacterium]|nr:hypothetical protein [bacterium]
MFNFKQLKQTNGVALLLTILIMFLILFLGIYVLNFSLTETKIATSQINGAKTYYLAEAGINEMVWKLKNNTDYKQNFETDPTWTTNFTRDNPFGANSGSYTTTITNTSLAHGTITSVGTINIGDNKTSQRIIKTYIYKALGQTNMGNNGGYADDNIDISISKVNFFDGNAHSNNKFTVNGFNAVVYVEQDLNAVTNYTKNPPATVNVGGAIHSPEYPPAPDPIAMPAIDFDSDDSESYKNKATVVYTEAEFEDLMRNNQTLTLNDPITYVIGDVSLRGGQNLIVNGLLVVSQDLNIGSTYFWGIRHGFSSITINHTAGQQSGIFAKKKIAFKASAGGINITGLVYACEQLSILSFPSDHTFTIVGGLVSRKLTITSFLRTLNIYYNNDVLADAFLATSFSPTVTVEHWEEEY